MLKGLKSSLYIDHHDLEIRMDELSCMFCLSITQLRLGIMNLIKHFANKITFTKCTLKSKVISIIQNYLSIMQNHNTKGLCVNWSVLKCQLECTEVMVNVCCIPIYRTS